MDSISQFRKSLTPDYTGVSSSPSQNVAATYVSPTTCPFDTNPTETTRGSLSTSNKHLPGLQDSTTWNRFFWVIQYAVGQVSTLPMELLQTKPCSECVWTAIVVQLSWQPHGRPTGDISSGSLLGAQQSICKVTPATRAMTVEILQECPTGFQLLRLMFRLM